MFEYYKIIKKWSTIKETESLKGDVSFSANMQLM